MSRRVLVVEDEPAIAETIVYALRTEHFEVKHSSRGEEALAACAAEAWDCVILDVGLPDISGFDVCRELRRSSQVPVIFLTARDGEIDRVLGLELGGDDYVAKPFSPRELVARVRAILRRSVAGRPELANAGPAVQQPTAQAVEPIVPALQHDEWRKTILCYGQPMELSRNEYHLLLTLLQQPGRVFSREQLLEVAWPDPGAVTDRTVDAHIRLLRAKLRERLGEEYDPIETRRGLGYALREDAVA
jgi:two-component system, OmpR family, catabolic regulation response regulator CreB